MIKVIKELWLIATERAKARKAIRLLVKQSWSLEFLVYILSKSVELSKKQCYIVLRNKDNQELIIHAGLPQENKYKQQERELDILSDNVHWEALRDAAEVHGLL